MHILSFNRIQIQNGPHFTGAMAEFRGPSICCWHNAVRDSKQTHRTESVLFQFCGELPSARSEWRWARHNLKYPFAFPMTSFFTRLTGRILPKPPSLYQQTMILNSWRLIFKLIIKSVVKFWRTLVYSQTPCDNRIRLLIFAVYSQGKFGNRNQHVTEKTHEVKMWLSQSHFHLFP